jgi:hypothetical protein
MRYDAVAFLESLFRSPASEDPDPAPASVPGIGPDDLPGDWRVEWEERAAIMEYDGGLPREHAEVAALNEIIRRMREIPARSDCPCRRCVRINGVAD